MIIESDDEFLALCRARFDKYDMSAEMAEQQISELLVAHRLIRESAQNGPAKSRWDAVSSEACDLATAQWALWSIEHHDCGAMPTEAHRIWSAVQTVIMWTRQSERSLIAKALCADMVAAAGPTASRLIEEAVVDAADIECE